MKLFLASQATNPLSLARLEEFTEGFKNKKIAYIPTAANGYKWERWKDGDSWKVVHTLGAHVELVLLEDYLSQDITKLTFNCDIIWFAGGLPGYLLYWIRRVGLQKILPEILERAVYVGSSAGSMITGNSLEIIEWYTGDEEPWASIIPTLKLVDFDIYPHYEESHLPIIQKKYKGKKMYLLKDGEEIIVDGSSTQVIGEERIVSGSSS